MARRLLTILLLFTATGIPVNTLAQNSLTVLSYHDVVSDKTHGTGVMAISVAELTAQFAWMKEHGYQPVSIDDLLAAQQGKRPLPEKPVVLTFDDGYRSVYTHVYPLLRLYNYPAVIALVGKWMDTGAGGVVRYDNEELPRERFLTWKQVREMTASGLVEVASHSYDLHHGVIANPQGNEEPAATTRLYDANSGKYEFDKSWRQRIQEDLAHNIQLINKHTGKKPRVMVWPYGSYNQPLIAIARDLGMTITMNLDDGRNDSDDLSALRRVLIPDNGTLSNLVYTLRRPDQARRIRVVHVDLDYVYDTDPVRQNHNLGLLIDRVRALGVNTVFLQAYADPDGNGSADALYFPNRHLPMRADLFNRVAWQLRTRAGVRVYAWMPVLAFEFEKTNSLAGYYIRADRTPPATAPLRKFHRLSPFHPDVRRAIEEVYEDLAIHADFAGILFNDDAILTDFEDSSPWALDYYADHWQLPRSVAEIRRSPELFAKWSQEKTQFLIDFTDRLTDRVRQYRPAVRTARNIFAGVALDPAAETWLAQSLPLSISHYDYTAIMAMPYLEGAENADQWLRALATRIAAIPGAIDKTILELQSVDWRNHEPIESDTLARHMSLLLDHGIQNFGYYPDDFVNGNPKIALIRPEISLYANPFIQP